MPTLTMGTTQILHKPVDPAGDAKKITGAARDFESLLLGTWLTQAEQTFATLPGGDQQDADPGKEQFMSMAMQSLASSITAAGGIGLAKMISQNLHETSAKPPAISPDIAFSHTSTER